MRGANGNVEFLKKIIGVFDKGFYVNFQTDENGGGFVEDKAALGRVHRPTDSIDQVQIIVKGKGDLGGKDFVRRKRHQLCLPHLA